MRKGNNNYNRSDHHGDREANWNNNSRARSAGSAATVAAKLRSQIQGQTDWHQSQNGSIRTNSTQSGSANAAYGMYPLPSLNPDGLSSNGPTISSVVMLYPYDHNTGYGSAEHLGFGSPGLGNLTLFGRNQELSTEG
ncbi:hypothetical protein NC652_033010 [Populus alba x Populus x berolinensis]|nr:hypothetical protein NC652_033010 [Populus alba x Populus x berolinensis]